MTHWNKIVQRAALLIVLFLVPAPLSAQYPRGRRTVSSGSAPQAYKGLVVTFHGVVKKLTKKEILLQSDDNQLLIIRCSRKTKFRDTNGEIKPSEIDLESRVSIDASEDNDLKLVAINVTLTAQPSKTLGK